MPYLAPPPVAKQRHRPHQSIENRPHHKDVGTSNVVLLVSIARPHHVGGVIDFLLLVLLRLCFLLFLKSLQLCFGLRHHWICLWHCLTTVRVVLWHCLGLGHVGVILLRHHAL